MAEMPDTMHEEAAVPDLSLAELLARMDAFCADLESQGWTVKRTRSAIRISPPPKPRRYGLGPSHGTVRRYQDKGCRCDECRAAKSRKQAAYRKRAAMREEEQ